MRHVRFLRHGVWSATVRGSGARERREDCGVLRAQPRRVLPAHGQVRRQRRQHERGLQVAQEPEGRPPRAHPHQGTSFFFIQIRQIILRHTCPSMRPPLTFAMGGC